MDIEMKFTREMVEKASMSVSGAERGYVRIDSAAEGGKELKCFLAPKYAVMLWRCLSGETETCMVPFRCDQSGDDGGGKMSVSYDDGLAMWRFRIDIYDLSFLLDADQALALAWALEESVPDAMKPIAEEEPRRWPVWALVTHQMLTGDVAIDGCDLIGGGVEMFSTRKKAEDRLRELLRSLVNESHPDGTLEETGRDVDSILDGIFESAQHAIGLPHEPHERDIYQYDGTSKSFVVELCCMGVD